MDIPGDLEGVETVAKRADFLELLSGEPRHKPDLVERSGHSRSTVDRAIRALEDAGFVERVTEGWVTTQAGRLAVERYRAFLQDERSILANRDVLNSLPHDRDLPMAMLSDAQTGVDEGHRLFELVAEGVSAADRYRVVLSELVDSRHVRLLHSGVVRDDLTVDLLGAPAVLERLREEFPHLTAELGAAEGFVAREGEVPPYSLLVGTGEGHRSVTLLTDDGDVGFVHARDATAVEWALNRFESWWEDVRDVTETFRGAETNADLARLTEDRVPAALRSEGFVRVDDRYFDRREPLPPVTGWRAGLGLPEVAAGYAVERTGGDAVDETVTERSIDALRDGEDLALLGPPGAGKSTVCKRVACEWYETEPGPVFYRESGTGDSLGSLAALERTLEATPDRALVVVEDAVRPEANAVFDVMRRFSGSDDVAFLLDARESEWHDPAEFPADARLEAFRQEAVDTVVMPGLDVDDCERLLARVGERTDEDVDVSADELLSVDAEEAAGPAEARPAGSMYLLFHRLSQYLDPLNESDGPTTLEEDVDSVRTDLSSIGEAAADVGFLAAVCTVAGLGVYPGYLRSLVADDDDRTPEVEAACRRLTGHVLFRSEASGPYRPIHERWAACYLSRALAEAGVETVRRRFERCAGALLSLADDPDRRTATADAVDVGDGLPDGLVAAPGDWAETVLSALFGLGTSYPKFATLYGTSDDPVVPVPEVCDEDVALSCTLWRGDLYLRANAFDRARAEFEALSEAASETDDAAADGYRIDGLIGRCRVASEVDDPETARRFGRSALDRAKAAADEYRIARCRAKLATVANGEGAFDRVADLATTAAETFRSVGAPREEASALRSAGLAARNQGDLETAERHFEDALALLRSVGDRRMMAEALQSMGTIASARHEFDTARERFMRSMELARERGDRRQEAELLGELGGVALRSGNLETAATYFERSVERTDETMRRTRRAALSNWASVALARGDLDTAEDCLDEALDLAHELDLRIDRGATLRTTARLRLFQDDYRAAAARAQEALDVVGGTNERRLQVEATLFRAKARLQLGEVDGARTLLEDALETAESIGYERKRLEVLSELALVAALNGDTETAAGHVATVESLVDDLGIEQRLDAAAAGSVALERGDLATADRRLDAAVSTYRSLDATRNVATTLSDFARVARRRDDPETASDRATEALSLAREHGFDLPAATARIELAAAERHREQFETAVDHCTEAVETLRHIDAGLALAHARHERGRIARDRGDLAAAREHLEAAFDQYRDGGADARTARVAADLAGVCTTLGDDAAAADYREDAEGVAVTEPPGAGTASGE